MFRSITWGGYVDALFIITVAYYAVVLVMYFRPDIIRLLSRQRKNCLSANIDHDAGDSS